MKRPGLAALVLILPSMAAAVDSTTPSAEIMQLHGSASLAFARYISSLPQNTPWKEETVEIEASLPKLDKRGHLLAVRKLASAGKPEYQVKNIEGDRTVRQQVIARYLNAEVEAASIPSASVAITPANYKFRYLGRIDTGDLHAYIFQITPRKKKEGLVQGELWLDAETGLAIRQSGYLVKRPSIFVKRVDVTRETYLRNGVAEMRVTRLSVETRLVGRGELMIRERPCGEGIDSTACPTAAPALTASAGER